MPQLLVRGYPIGRVKGVLFDKDGTLSQSESYLLNLAKLRIVEASNLLKEQTSNSSDIKQLEHLLNGAYGLSNSGLSPNGTIAIASRDDNLISTATVFCILGETWPRALEMAKSIFNKVDAMKGTVETNANPRSLLPGVLEMLEHLNEAQVICALISNDTQLGIKSFLNMNNLEDKIIDFWSAEHHPAKPDPCAVKKLCKSLNLQPSECALIGDADSDLIMARQAGIGITLGYTAGWTQPTHLTAHEHLIDNWNELTIK